MRAIAYSEGTTIVGFRNPFTVGDIRLGLQVLEFAYAPWLATSFRHCRMIAVSGVILRRNQSVTTCPVWIDWSAATTILRLFTASFM